MELAPAELVDAEVQIATINTDAHNSDPDIISLFEERTGPDKFCEDSFGSEQMKDSTLWPLLEYLLDGKLPADPAGRASIMTQASDYTTVDRILYYICQKKDNVPTVVVPEGMRQKLIEDYHAGNMAGHFSGPKPCQDYGGGIVCTRTSLTMPGTVPNTLLSLGQVGSSNAIYPH